MATALLAARYRNTGHEPAVTQEGQGLQVMFFLPQLGGGGAEMNAVRLAPGLIAAGVTPTYVVTRGPGSFADYLPDDVEVIVLDTGSVNSSTLRLIRAVKPLAKLVNERDPDILCPVMVTPTLSALAALRRCARKPAVMASIQNSLSVTHEAEPRLRDRLELQLIKRWFPRLDGVIALSKGVAAEIRDLVPVLDGCVHVVPNVGLPLPSQTRSAPHVTPASSSQSVRLLACGRLTRQKDYPTLLRAFAKLEGGAVCLDILGDGELGEELRKVAGELGISERVKFLGFQADPISRMQQADIFVLSSRWEGFGNVLVEAMSVGTPVVSTDCPHGPSDIIDHDITGLLVPPENPDTLATALQKMIDNPELRSRIGKAGQNRAHDFSTEKVGAQYAAVVGRFLARTT